MPHTRRSALVGTFVLLAAILTGGCSNIAAKDIHAARTRLHHEPLTMHADGLPDASIDTSGAVTIDSDPLSLTDARQNTALRYRHAVIDLADLALDVSAQLTEHAVLRSLFAVATGREDAMEQDIEKQARAMTHSPAFCQQLDVVRQRQQQLVQAVAKLQPYAHLSRQNVENCFAGKAYKTDL